MVVESVDDTLAQDTLVSLQLPAGNTLGAVILNTGGIHFHGGKMRLLGSPSPNAGHRGLMSWNADVGLGADKGVLLIGDDVLGNFYAVDLGGVETDGSGMGAVCALSPAYGDWVLLADRYSEFAFSLLDDYWPELIDKMGLSAAIKLIEKSGDVADLAASYYPPLFSVEGSEITSDVRLIDVEENFKIARELRTLLF
jgi:hypothetical protein